LSESAASAAAAKTLPGIGLRPGVRIHGLTEAGLLTTETALGTALAKAATLAPATSLRSKSASVEAPLPSGTTTLTTLTTSWLPTTLTLLLTCEASATRTAEPSGLLCTKWLARLPFSKHLRCASLKQVSAPSELLIHGRSINRAIWIDGQETKPFSGNWIGIGSSQKTDAVGVEKRFDVGREDTEATLIFLYGTDVFLPAKYQFLLHFSLGLHLIRGCRSSQSD